MSLSAFISHIKCTVYVVVVEASQPFWSRSDYLISICLPLFLFHFVVLVLLYKYWLFRQFSSHSCFLFEIGLGLLYPVFPLTLCQIVIVTIL